ncbi:hypothetical protein P7C70_g2764, partial [Phenoliferia sp. Uapishka_3]
MAPLEPPPASAWFVDGTYDPRDTALSPWLWVPLVFTMVSCIVFVSIRRAHSLEIWARMVDFYHLHSPFTTSPSSIRLSSSQSARRRQLHRTTSTSSSTSDSSEDEDLNQELDDTLDELPSTPPIPRTSFPRLAINGLNSVLDTLGWTGRNEDGNGDFGPGPNGGAGDKSAGILRAFWGIRKGDRKGRIRLGGDNSDEESGRRRSSKPILNLGKSTAALVDSLPPLYPSSPGSRTPQSPRASSASPSLFDLGEEDEEGDAVELPREFELRESGSDVNGEGSHPLAWEGGGKLVAGDKGRGMMRL